MKIVRRILTPQSAIRKVGKRKKSQRIQRANFEHSTEMWNIIMKKNLARKDSTTSVSSDHSQRATTLMEEGRDDTKEYVRKVSQLKQSNSSAAESATTFTSYSIDATLAEAE